jgi:hypothetical protein
VLRPDPFRPADSLQLRRQEHTWIAYSVGQDGEDDGGDDEKDLILWRLPEGE